ncbi:MAG: sugar ABC transporter substrate-binding protein [Christensenellales bacterium]
MKKILCNVLVLLMALSVLFISACSAPAPVATSAPSAPSVATAAPTQKPREPVNIAFIIRRFDSPYYVKVKESVLKTVSELHPEDKITVFDCGNDLNKELSITEDVLTQKFDAILLTPIDYEGTSASVKKIKDAGIPLILLDTETANYKLADMSIMVDNEETGYLSMMALAKAINYKGKIVVYESVYSSSGRERNTGRDRVLAQYRDIKIVNRQTAPANPDVAMEFMNNALQADPDIVGAWSINDPCALGMLASAKVVGLADQISFVGIDGSTEAIDAIKKGEMLATAAQFPRTLGKMGVEFLYKLLEGQPIEEKHIRFATLLVDKDNVNTFIPE